MSTLRHLLAAVLAFGSLCFLPGTARAAQSLDTCTGFIDTLPATIGTQGVWCLRHDLNTGMTSGNAIKITTNNVTIDCNDFKIGGLAAGNASQTYGIYANNLQNITVRHCSVRGFLYGIFLDGGAGHLVEDNRLDNNLYFGIDVLPADNSLVQRNRVFSTGGYPGSDTSFAIQANADILDNTVSGVYATATDTNPHGIYAWGGSGTTVHGNRVRGLTVAGSGVAYGISVVGGITVDGNQITAANATAGYGIYGAGSVCSNNTVVNFATNYNSCTYSLNNVSLPLPPP